MRLSLAISFAALASVLSVEAGPCSSYYTVVQDDNCLKIASKYGVTVNSLLSSNSAIDPACSNLFIGQKLCINGTSTNKTTTTKKTTKKTSTKKTSTKKTSTKKTSTKKTSTKKTTTKKTTTKKTSTKKTSTKKTSTKKTTTKKTTTKKTSTKKKATTTVIAPPSVVVNGATYYTGLTMHITSAKDFCMLLPSSPGGKEANGGVVDDEAISKSEKSALVFCQKPNSTKAPGAKLLPNNFIKTSYYYRNETAGYVQVTGSLRPELYELSTVDGGGQYDNHGRGSPAFSNCYGYKYYVGLIEPDRSDYCFRCCDVYEDCNAGRSTYGCRRVVQNGVYDA